MLCEMSGDDENEEALGKRTQLMDTQATNDSYQVLLREVKRDYEIQEAEELNDFKEVFSVRDLLGVGAFGVVLLVKNKMTREKSALKIINKERLTQKAQSILKNESAILQSMDHPSVVSFKRIFENMKFIILEMELIPGG